MNRSEISRALAKAIAYKQCGKDHKAAMWAAELIRQLECAEIMTPDFRNTSIREHEAA